ncbi:MAG: hypothetical protein F6K35_25440 [Okeania sp. SIO2H7]|nr:hypothetical protein [Okeania sp. SIO2H7]
MGLTLRVISQKWELLLELMPKKLRPLISSLAMVDLSASLPASGKPSCRLYWANSLKVLFVFLLLFERSLPILSLFEKSDRPSKTNRVRGAIALS